VLKFLLVVVLFAVLTYAAFRVIERRGLSGSPAPSNRPSSRPRPRRPAPRPVAPDDDEDFLRGLDRKRRKDPPPT
jgi:hypothetical protein